MAGPSELVNTFFHSLRASNAFWICALIGSIFSVVLLSCEVFYWGGTYLGAMINIAKVCALAIAILLWFRSYYQKNQAQLYHPMDLLPQLCFISFFFATTATILLFNPHGTSPKGIIRFITDLYSIRREYPDFRRIIGSFIIYTYAILSWLMVYVFIKSERNCEKTVRLTHKSVAFGALSLFGIHEIIKIITITAYYEFPDFMFSLEFLWGEIWLAIISICLSSYVFLLRPDNFIFNSRFLPKLPTFVVLVFCSSFICMWTTELISYFYHLIFTDNKYSFAEQFAQPFGGTHPIWIDIDQFTGMLRSRFNEQFISAMFLMYLHFSIRWKKVESSAYHKIDIKNSLLFWVYNLVGWTCAGTYLYFSDLLGISKAGKVIPEVFIFSYVFFGFFLSFMLRSIIKNFHILTSSLIELAYKIFLLSCIFGVFLAIALSMMSYLYISGAFGHEVLLDKQEFFNGFNYFKKCVPWFVLCFALWSLIYHIAVSQRTSLQNEIRKLQLEKNLKELQLNTLAGKIDPHFIFNALNNIRVLVRVDAEKARDSILVLSDILRNPIQKNYQEKIPLVEELTLVRKYLKLSHIHLGNRLEYRESIEPGIDNAVIPSMMLQIMMENAIKHGINPLPGGGTLSLDIHSSDQEIVCIMTNTGQLQSEFATQGFGIGLKNIKERLSLLYGTKGSFHLYETHQLVVARLILPLEFSI